MKKDLNFFYAQEINNYYIAIKNQNIIDAWTSLERAHVLGQFFWKKHLHIHFLMFALSLKTFDFKEALAQIPRIILAAPGSLLSKAPKGNVGTARVGIFEPMPIPDDLKQILDSCEVKKQ